MGLCNKYSFPAEIIHETFNFQRLLPLLAQKKVLQQQDYILDVSM